jgi:cytochrome P450
MEERIRTLVVDLLAPVKTGQEVDFVAAISLPLPILVIAELMGIPTEDRAHFAVWSDAVIGAAEQQSPENMGGVFELLGYFQKPLERRRKQPGDVRLPTRRFRRSITGSPSDRNSRGETWASRVTGPSSSCVP